MGMGTVSLRALVSLRRCVGVVAWTGDCGVYPVLVSRVRIVLWLGRRLWVWRWLWRMGRLRLASDWALRLFPSLVGRISRPVRRGRLPGRFQSLWRVRALAQRNAVFECGQPARPAHWPGDVHGECGSLRGRPGYRRGSDERAVARGANDG